MKGARCTALVRLQESIALGHNEAAVGRTVEVLVESVSKTNAKRLAGHTKDDKIVVFEGPESCVGRLVPVGIESATAHTLYARLLGDPVAGRRLPLIASSGTVPSLLPQQRSPQQAL